MILQAILKTDKLYITYIRSSAIMAVIDTRTQRWALAALKLAHANSAAKNALADANDGGGAKTVTFWC